MASRPQPPTTVPRGRHAPPLEVRLTVQRRRLFESAAAVFSRVGYAEASAEAIAREAGMSKATFYEHFANKEECIVALFDEAAVEISLAMADAVGEREEADSYADWVRRGLNGFLRVIADHPAESQTLLVAIIGAGPNAIARRDQVLDQFADVIFRDNARMAPPFGEKVFASRDDAFAAIGGLVEVVTRELRTGAPPDVLALEPVLQRLLFGILSQGLDEPPRARG